MLNDDDGIPDVSTSSEERKTTGRMVALVGASMLLGLAIYHAWIRKTAVLAGVIVPAAIMILYAIWVVVLTKRDRRRFRRSELELQSLSSIADYSLTDIVSGQPTSINSSMAHIIDNTRSQHRYGHRRRRKHEKFLRTKIKLLKQQRQMKNMKLNPMLVALHRSKSLT